MNSLTCSMLNRQLKPERKIFIWMDISDLYTQVPGWTPTSFLFVCLPDCKETENMSLFKKNKPGIVPASEVFQDL